MQVRCLHCHEPVELSDESDFSSLSCKSCGSNFSLVGDHTLSYKAAKVRTIGHFELIEQVGIGAFGSVWKARDKELDRTVAVKVPRKGELNSEEAEQFLREARAAAQLRHPNIVGVHEVGREDDSVYIVSDFVEGATLDDWLTGQQLSCREAAELIAKIADALDHAHRSGVIHRDLKPGNIMLDLDAEPHLMDFGLARRTAGEITMTVEGRVLGTPAYMSPEQARGEGHQADRRTDIYSAGVVLFKLMTGELPFRGNPQMLIVQIQREEPPSPRRLNSRIPRDLETICLKCLEKSPDQRYSTAAELAAELRRWLKGEPIQARPISSTARIWRWCRRNPMVASLATAVAFLLIAGTTIATYFAIDATLARYRADGKAIEAELSARQALAEKERADRQAREAEISAAEAHASLYAVRMNMIQLAWDNGNEPLARDLLELVRRGQPEQNDLRGWEWHYFQRLCEQMADTIQPNAGSIESLAFNPDGRRIVTSGETVKVWDAATCSELFTLKSHESQDGVAFSPDGKLIATVGDRVRIWDATTGQELLVLKNSGPGKSVAFSPDGNRLAAGCSDRSIRVWDSASGKELQEFVGHSDQVECVAYSPGGEQLASASRDQTVRLWDTVDGRELFRLQGHDGPVLAVAFHPGGLQLASCGDDTDLSINLWDTRSGELLRALSGHSRRVYAVAFSPDGRHLASGSSDDTMKIWDATRGLELQTYSGHESGVHSLAFSPDGLRLATGSSDTTVHLLDILREPGPRIFNGHTDQVRAVSFTGWRLVSVGLDGKINVWDVETGQEQRLFPKTRIGYLGMAISSDGRHLATANNFGQISVRSLTSGKELWKKKGHPSWASAVVFSADARLLASGGARSLTNRDEPILIKLWEASTGKELRSFQGHHGEVTALAFAPDAGRLVSGSSDSTLRVWDVAKGAELRTLRGHTRGVTSIALDREGSLLLSASSDRTVRLWDLTKGQEVRTGLGHFDTIWSVALHPDGKRIATAGWDKTVRVWDIATGLELANLKGHADRVLGVAFSADGNYLASAGGIDRTVRLWDARESTAQSKAEDEARWLVDALFAKPLTKSDVLATLRRDRLIDDTVRARAMELADRFKEETDTKEYHDAAWAVIRHPNSNIFMCQIALSQASFACERKPDHGAYRIGLGVAQYRLGRFQNELYGDALATLSKCDQEQPVALAFLCMSQHQLGQREQSQATLTRLSQIIQEPRWAGNNEAEAFWREAAALIRGRSAHSLP